MAQSLAIFTLLDHDEFIDFELNESFPTLTYNHTSSDPYEAREFHEFKRSPSSLICTGRTFPAQELFYTGKLLPLHHFPPMLKMVENLRDEDEYYTITFGDDPTPSSCFSSTPSDSCDVSSCHELSPAGDCLLQWSAESGSCFSDDPDKKFRGSKKINKYAVIIGKKLKSLFTKLSCSDHSDDHESSRSKPCSNHLKAAENHTRKKFIIENPEKRSAALRLGTSSSGRLTSYNSAIASSAAMRNIDGQGSANSSFRRGTSTSTDEIEAVIEYCKTSQKMTGDSRK